MTINYKELILKFCTEVGGYYPAVSSSYALYPFPYADKTLTFDWDNIGTDLCLSIIKYGQKKNEK